MPSSINERVRKRRDTMRAMGMRPVQIWVPDTRQPGFAEECRRQATLVAAADDDERGIQDFLDAALEDLGPDRE